MKNLMTKSVSILLSLLMLFSLITPVSAADSDTASQTSANLKITVSADKKDYSADEKIIFTVTVENRGNDDANDVTVKNISDLRLKMSNSAKQIKIGSIPAGKKVTKTVEAVGYILAESGIEAVDEHINTITEFINVLKIFLGKLLALFVPNVTVCNVTMDSKTVCIISIANGYIKNAPTQNKPVEPEEPAEPEEPSEPSNPSDPPATEYVNVSIDQTPFTTTDINTVITGTFESSSAISKIEYLIESENAEDESGNPVVDMNKFELSVRLRTGLNKITVTVTDINNHTNSDSVEVTYNMGQIQDPSDYDIGEHEDILYRKGIILLYFKNGVSEHDALQIIEDYNGEVVGNNYFLNFYEAKFDVVDYEALVLLASELQELPEISTAIVDVLLDSDSVSINVTDPWNGDTDNDDWNDNDVDGSNWGLEAIDIKNAWKYDERLSKQPARVGIVDSGFEYTHEDFENVNLYNVDSEQYNFMGSSHGTHVAGTIAADINNGKGISGILNYANLYLASAGVSASSLSSSKIQQGFVSAVINGAKVVNFSLGRDGVADNMTAKKGSAAIAIESMSRLLFEGFDFLCVQSAGNSGEDNIAADRNGWFCSITPDMDISDITTSFSVQDLIDHCIIVGAAENTVTENGYELSSYSNFGSRVDIVAPGSDIYSCIWNNGYGYKSGTSMAAPHVTAVVGLVWSLNPEFSMKEIKDIICSAETTTSAYDTDRSTAYRMLNAGLAADEAVARTDAIGMAYGTFVDATTGYPVESGTYKIHKDNAEGELFGEEITFTNGAFSFTAPAGKYVLEITGDNGYIRRFLTIEMVAAGTVNCGDISLSKALTDNQIRIVLSWGEYPSDLDSHITGSTVYGTDFHVYYSNKYYTYDGENLVWLDVDDTTSYGPETITVVDFDKIDNFKYTIHNYSDLHATSSDPEAFNLADSGATVDVYSGDVLIATYSVPVNTKGTEWEVFSMDASGTITVLNNVSYESSPYDVGR